MNASMVRRWSKALKVAGVFAVDEHNMETENAQRNALMQALTLLQPGQNPSKGLPLSGRYLLDMKGLPLGLEHRKGGWIVYSVGRNRADDHNTSPNVFIDDFIVPLTKPALSAAEWARADPYPLSYGGI